MLTIRLIFLYLDRTYVITATSVRSLFDMGLHLFRKHLALHPEVGKISGARVKGGGIILEVIGSNSIYNIFIAFDYFLSHNFTQVLQSVLWSFGGVTVYRVAQI